MANTIGAYQADGVNDIGAYEAPLPAAGGAGGGYLRRRRELHIRRQVAKRLGLRELWSGQKRTKRLY